MLEDISDVGCFLACVGEDCSFVFGILCLLFLCCFVGGVS
jgi:hypothetical protein